MNKLACSIIFGFIIGMVLFNSFYDNIIYHGPNSSQIKKQRYYSPDGTCYRFKPIPYVCPLRINIK